MTDYDRTDYKQTFANSGRSRMKHPIGEPRPCTKCGKLHTRRKSNGYMASHCHQCHNTYCREMYRRKNGRTD